MVPSKFVRASGLALMLSGIFVAVPTLVHPDEIADPSVMQSASWVSIHTAFIAGVFLSIFGLFGLWLRLREKGGFWADVGFGLTFVGSVLTVAILTLDAYVFPVIAADTSSQALLDPNGPLLAGPLGLVFMLAAVIYALGTFVLGTAVIRAGTLPLGAGGLLLVGGPIMGFSGLLPHLVFLIGGVLLGASLIWLGYVMWSNQARDMATMPLSAKA